MRSSSNRTCRHTRTVNARLHQNKMKRISSCMLRNSIPEWGSHHPHSHFLILLKSGNQYRSTFMINMRAVVCMYIFCACKMDWSVKRLLEMLLIRGYVSFCESVTKLYFQSYVWTAFFLSLYVIPLNFNLGFCGFKLSFETCMNLLMLVLHCVCN